MGAAVGPGFIPPFDGPTLPAAPRRVGYKPLVPAWSAQQDNSSPKTRRALTATAINLAEVLAAGMGKSVCSPCGCEIQILKNKISSAFGNRDHAQKNRPKNLKCAARCKRFNCESMRGNLRSGFASSNLISAIRWTPGR